MVEHSAELIEMLASKKGYRNSEYYGAGISNLEEILCHEIGEMGNTDVLDFMVENYSLELNYKAKLGDCFGEEEIDNFSKEEIQSILEATTSETVVENYSYFVDKVLNAIKAKVGTRELYGVWLTTQDGVEEHYYRSGSVTDGYQLTERVLPISDLRGYGALFVYSQNPNKFKIDSVFQV